MKNVPRRCLVLLVLVAASVPAVAQDAPSLHALVDRYAALSSYCDAGTHTVEIPAPVSCVEGAVRALRAPRWPLQA